MHMFSFMYNLYYIHYIQIIYYKHKDHLNILTDFSVFYYLSYLYNKYKYLFFFFFSRAALDRAAVLLKMSMGGLRIDNQWATGGGQRPVIQLIKEVILHITYSSVFYYSVFDQSSVEPVINGFLFHKTVMEHLQQVKSCATCLLVCLVFFFPQKNLFN